MALPPNPKLDDAIAHADTDTLAMAYAVLRLADALNNLGAQSPALVAALNNIANKVEDGTDKIANAITNHP